MQDDRLTLHLIDLGMAYSGAGYLLLATAVMHLALRCRAPWLMLSAMCFALLAFVKLSIVGRGLLVWYGAMPSETADPVAVQWVARVDSIILVVAAIAVAIFAIASAGAHAQGRQRR